MLRPHFHFYIILLTITWSLSKGHAVIQPCASDGVLTASTLWIILDYISTLSHLIPPFTLNTLLNSIWWYGLLWCRLVYIFLPFNQGFENCTGKRCVMCIYSIISMKQSGRLGVGARGITLLGVWDRTIGYRLYHKFLEIFV